MGYKNLSKGCSRIADWEQSRERPFGDRPEVLARALELPPPRLTELLSRWDAIERESERVERARVVRDEQIHTREWALIAAHRDALFESLDVLECSPGAMGAGVLSASYALSFMGGGSLSLWTLLSAWKRGIWTLDCEGCEDTFYVHAVTGSLLSGTNRIHGVCECPPAKRHERLPSDIRLGVFLRQILNRERGDKRPLKADPTVACWSVSDVLAALDLSAPDVRISAPGGELIATWSPSSQRVCGADESILAHLPRAEPPVAAEGDGSCSPAGARWYEDLRPFRERRQGVRRPATSSRFGSWRGNHLELETERGQHRRVTPGHLCRADGTPIAVFSDSLPVRVLGWVHEHLGEG